MPPFGDPILIWQIHFSSNIFIKPKNWGNFQYTDSVLWHLHERLWNKRAEKQDTIPWFAARFYPFFPWRRQKYPLFHTASGAKFKCFKAHMQHKKYSYYWTRASIYMFKKSKIIRIFQGIRLWYFQSSVEWEKCSKSVIKSFYVILSLKFFLFSGFSITLIFTVLWSFFSVPAPLLTAYSFRYVNDMNQFITCVNFLSCQ